MKLTHEHIGLEMVRIHGNAITPRPITIDGVVIQRPSSVKDFSYIAEPLKLVHINEDGSLILERYDPSHRSYQKWEIEKYNEVIDLPKEEGYVFLELEARWNDEHWEFFTYKNAKEGRTNHSKGLRHHRLTPWNDYNPWIMPDIDFHSISFPSRIIRDFLWKAPFIDLEYPISNKEELQGVLTSYLKETIPAICYITEKRVLSTPKIIHSIPLPSKQFRQLKEKETNKKRLKKTV